MNREQLKWLREFSPSHYIQETQQEFNKKFDTNKSYDSIKNILRRYKIPKLVKNKLDNLKPRMAIHTEKDKIKWIKENRNCYKNLSLLLEEFNKCFNLEISYEAFRHIVYVHGIKSDKRKDPHLYTEEEIKWVKENYNKYTTTYRFNTNSFIQDFNKKFGLLLKKHNVKYLIGTICKLSLNYDRQYTYYEYMSQLYPIGHERKIHGEWYVKIDTKPLIGEKRDERFNYRKKSHILYEQYHNVKVNDETHIVIYIDENFENLSKDNLYLLSRKAERILVGSKYKNACLETRMNAIKIAEIQALLKVVE